MLAGSSMTKRGTALNESPSEKEGKSTGETTHQCSWGPQ